MKLLLALFLATSFSAHSETVTLGSKNFTESYILGEWLAQTLRQQDVKVKKRFGLGGTGVAQESLKQGEVDIYPEYTGTIIETVIKKKMENPSISALNQELEKLGLTISEPLGFNNTYAIVVRRETAEKFQLKALSDLGKVASQLRGGLGHEFLNRSDGFYELKKFYGYGAFKSIIGLEHSLAYEALAHGKVDFTDAYTTDGKLGKFDFVILEDDRKFFPAYEAVWITRIEFAKEHPEIWKTAQGLSAQITEELMVKMNAAVEDKMFTSQQVVGQMGLVDGGGHTNDRVFLKRLSRYGKEHLILVSISVLVALIIGFPLAYGATKNQNLRQAVMFVSSIFQTIPSLALLCFMIPFFGVGPLPALIALVLYAFLPIVVNSYTGLSLVGKNHLDMAKQLGMSPFQTLRYVQIPLALPSILDGIKTSAITTVGTATLAALIGAGGFGTPILSGLALNDQGKILEGAIPVCVLALMTQLIFQLLERRLVSRGLY